MATKKATDAEAKAAEEKAAAEAEAKAAEEKAAADAESTEGKPPSAAERIKALTNKAIAAERSGRRLSPAWRKNKVEALDPETATDAELTQLEAELDEKVGALAE